MSDTVSPGGALPPVNPDPMADRPLGSQFPRIDTSKPTEAWDPQTGAVTPTGEDRTEIPNP